MNKKDLIMRQYKLIYTGSIPITIVGYGEIQPNTFKMVDLKTAISFVNAKNFQVDLSSIKLEKEKTHKVYKYKNEDLEN
jgi:hypothetical protein